MMFIPHGKKGLYLKESASFNMYLWGLSLHADVIKDQNITAVNFYIQWKWFEYLCLIFVHCLNNFASLNTNK